VFQETAEGSSDFFKHGRGVGFSAAAGFFDNFDFGFDGNFRSADCSMTLELCYTA
jgi:hypothetical protein